MNIPISDILIIIFLIIIILLILGIGFWFLFKNKKREGDDSEENSNINNNADLIEKIKSNDSENRRIFSEDLNKKSDDIINKINDGLVDKFKISDIENQIKFSEDLNNKSNHIISKINDNLVDKFKISDNQNQIKFSEDLNNKSNHIINKINDNLVDKFKSSDNENQRIFSENLNIKSNQIVNKINLDLVEKFKSSDNQNQRKFSDNLNIKSDQIVNKINLDLVEKFKSSDNQNQRKFSENLNIKSDEIINKITENLQNKVEELSKLTEKSFTQINQITNIFFNNKAKGTLGEATLESILSNNFGSYETQNIWGKQVKLQNDSVVDFDFKIGEKRKIAIDSKFPTNDWDRVQGKQKELSESTTITDRDKIKNELVKNNTSFFNSIKAMADQVNEKYIKNNEEYVLGLIYIPSEGIYNYLLENFYDKLIKYFGNKNKIIFVSPTSLNYIILIAKTIYEQEKIAADLPKILDKLNIYHEDSGRLFDRWKQIHKTLKKLEETDINKFNISIEKLEKDYQKIRVEAEKKFELVGSDDEVKKEMKI